MDSMLERFIIEARWSKPGPHVRSDIRRREVAATRMQWRDDMLPFRKEQCNGNAACEEREPRSERWPVHGRTVPQVALVQTVVTMRVGRSCAPIRRSSAASANTRGTSFPGA